MTVLAVETSCDETSVAIVRKGLVLANVVSSQVAMHEEYGGVVPELAAREHLKHLLPTGRMALKQAGMKIADMEAVCATQGPGLAGALIVGFTAAQTTALVLGKPFLGINHHEAHLYSPWIQGDPPQADFSQFVPNISLIVSGGHTMLVLVREELGHRVLGRTLDDAAGECFDKTGKLMGLPYPAGPEIDRLAEYGNPKAYDFPRPLIREQHDDFSFSGLKTAVRYFLQKNPGLKDNIQEMRNVCASVQAAIVDVLVTKTIRAASRHGVQCITVSGGVACNRVLRKELGIACKKAGLSLRLATPAFSTDNAAMIGILAERKLAHGTQTTPLQADIAPNWALA